MDFQKRQAAAERKEREAEKRRRHEERTEAINKYKERKAERYKVLSKKTKKGQPVMAGRMELLLQKIQST